MYDVTICILQTSILKKIVLTYMVNEFASPQRKKKVLQGTKIRLPWEWVSDRSP